MSYIYRFPEPPAAMLPEPHTCRECRRDAATLQAAGAGVIVCRQCFGHTCTACTETHEQGFAVGGHGRSRRSSSPFAVLELRSNTVWRVCRRCLPASGSYPAVATAEAAKIVTVAAPVHGSALEARVYHDFNEYRLEHRAYAPSAAATRELE